MDNIPEKIVIKEGQFTSKKRGRKTTIARRREAVPEKGKVSGSRTHYTDQEKMECACTFAVTGNSRRTSEITGIAEGTIRAWKSTEWWNELQSRIIKEQDEELTTKLTKLVDKAFDEVSDRLQQGDYIYNPKIDKLVRKPVNAKDLAIVGAVLVDKRQLLRGQPTSRIEKVSQEDTLAKLAQEFKRFAQATQVEQIPPSQQEVKDIELLDVDNRDTPTE